MWADIDYMQDYKDFTVDQTNFGDLGTYMHDLKVSNKVKFVPIIDAGVAERLASIDDYPAYTSGVDQDIFIKSGASNFYNHQVR
jgi:alpha-glucosidase